MCNRKITAIFAALFLSFSAHAQVINPGTPTSGSPANNDCAKFVVSGGNVQSITTTGAGCAAAISGANPTATASDTAVNGVASTFMRSDAAPAVQKATGAQFGLVECGTGTTCTGGVISSAVGANPTATASDIAVNGVATTFMRSDAAPAVQKGTNAQFGIVKSDGTTITCTTGTCVVAAITFGGQSVSPGGTAGVQGNGAKIQLSTGTTTLNNCVKFDTNGNTVDNGAPCGGASGANPSATGSDTAVNGVALTFMRSDAAPAIQKATNAQFGLAECDNVLISCAAGVVSGKTSTATNSLGADVTVTGANTNTDGPSMAQGTSGTWAVFGTVTFLDTTSANTVVKCKLNDGTTTISSGGFQLGNAGAPMTLALSGTLASPAGNIRITCQSNTATGVFKFNFSGNSKDSTISGHRIQ